jgi:hypothetical protein
MIADCAYVGDSIAVGLRQMDAQCAVYAKVGANTDYITKHYKGAQGAMYTVISMGSNAPLNPRNTANARKLRRSVQSDLVIWVLPYNRTAAEAIKVVAREFGDGWVDLKVFPSKDHVHPSGYRKVSKQIKNSVTYYYD